MLNDLKQRVCLDVWMEGSLRNGMAPVCDLESVCNAEEIILFFFFSDVQYLCVEATTDSLNQRQTVTTGGDCDRLI